MALTEDDCSAYIEQIIWNGEPLCPYCGSANSTRIEKESRYHCNYCFTSYSVTVNTLFHHSHIKLTKWFKAIFLLIMSMHDISSRRLAAEIGVTRNTALSMKKRIQSAKEHDIVQLEMIANFYKRYADEQ